MSENRVVYVALLNEGTDVWRPVAAEQVGPHDFRLLDSRPEGEEWQFSPGTVVSCEPRTFSGGATGLVAVRESLC